jgi:hypothetical protein
MSNTHEASRRRLSSLIEFARREGWEARLTGDRLMLFKPGRPPIFTYPAREARALSPSPGGCDA